MTRRDKIIQEVLVHKIIAIVRGVGYESLTALAKAFYDGGIRLMEVTFDQRDTDGFHKTTEAISHLCETAPEGMIIGAGTVVSPEQTELAYRAGAKFIVSPDTNPKVIRHTIACGMVSMPGAMTPTEVLRAHEAGADFVKLFPAGTLGTGYLRSLTSGPLSHIRFLAVGGIDEKNLAGYLHAGAVGAGIGGSLVNKDWIKNGDFYAIREQAKRIVQETMNERYVCDIR